MTVTAEAGAAPAGTIVRARLPAPRVYSHQDGFEFVSSSAPILRIDGPESTIHASQGVDAFR